MQIFSLIAFSLLWLLNALLVWGLHRQWWELRWVRRTLWIAPLVAFLFMGLWALGGALDLRWLNRLGGTLTAFAAACSIALLLALPVSGLILTGERVVERFSRKRRRPVASETGGPVAAESAAEAPAVPAPDTTASPVSRPLIIEAAGRDGGASGSPLPGAGQGAEGTNRHRRSFLTKAAAVLPVMTLGSAAAGLLRSQESVLMPEIPFSFPGLHPALDGLRILHLSDIHIGPYVDLDDLEDVMLAAEKRRPDLVLVSGDISDDLSRLPAALRLIAALKPRYGTFASLGNHEYFRGIDTVLRVLDAGPVPLLRDAGAALKIGGAELYIGGADDPVRMAQRERNYQFLRQTVDAAFDGAPSSAFHLLMSHRPQGFDIAADQGIALTVSGHTHGAQIGVNGRSILEPWMREHYLWGHYQRNGSHLYTSAGVGHWFPFRLGCPAEAPIYILKRG